MELVDVENNVVVGKVAARPQAGEFARLPIGDLGAVNWYRVLRVVHEADRSYAVVRSVRNPALGDPGEKVIADIESAFNQQG